MKKNKLLIVTFIAVCFLASCIKNDPVIFKDTQAEIDAASYNANAAGLTYPIIPRNLPAGRAAGTSDSTLRRWPHIVKIRVNLIGAVTNADRTVTYETFNSPITTINFPATITGQTPSAAAAALTVSDAVVGTHYATLSGTVVIPAGSSFGFIDVQILNPGPSAGQAKFLGIKLNTSGTVKPATNYSQIGLVIDQR